MNINDVYITKVFIVDNIEYKPHFISIHHAKYIRTTVVLRKEKYGGVSYYDLLAVRYIEHNMSHCDIGDEVIAIEKMYINLVDHIGYHGFKNVSKRKVKRLIKKKAQEERK